MTSIDLGAVAISATLAMGCGDPLVGTWVTHAYPGGPLPADVTAYQEELTFGSDMSFGVSIVLQVPASAAVYSGCTQTCSLDELQWVSSSDNGKMTLTVSGVARKTASRTGCTSKEDDVPDAPATSTDCPPGMPEGAYTYSVSDGTLTTTDASGSVATYKLSGN